MNFAGCVWDNGQNIISRLEVFTNAIYMRRIKIMKIFKEFKNSKKKQNKNYKGIYFFSKDLIIIKNQKI
jgi:hypothetical protein